MIVSEEAWIVEISTGWAIRKFNYRIMNFAEHCELGLTDKNDCFLCIEQ
jgi:hypothetical protein